MKKPNVVSIYLRLNRHTFRGFQNMLIKRWTSGAEGWAEDGLLRLKCQKIRSTVHIKAEIGMERLDQNI